MLLPDQKMMEFLSWQRGIFLHFGIRSFHPERRDWDYVHMPGETFAPQRLDCEQWAQVIREYLEAMRKYDIKTGLYYSPADQMIFKQKLSSEQHNELIFHHIRELCTQYGPIDYLWFDNCGSERCRYDWDRIMREIIDVHQPDMVVNSNGHVHSCWVGNEAGYAPYPAKYIHHVTTYGRDRLSQSALQRVENDSFFSPAEADCMLDDRSWFYRPQRNIKSVDTLMGIYYYSVGRGINLLLNVAPAPSGRIPDADAERLFEFNSEIQRRFSHRVADLRQLQHDPLSPNIHKITFDHDVTVDHLVLGENIAKHGKAIKSFRVCAQPYLHAQEPIEITTGRGVGFQAILPFPTLMLRELWVEVLDAETQYELTRFDLYSPCARS